ncbi:MAG: hypothetical protein ABGY75_02025 [Gemmataceae bacterium]
MRVFRFLAVGCTVGAVAVGAFTGGVWVARPKAPETVKLPRPATAPKPRDMPKAQNKASTVVRPVSHETPLPQPGNAKMPELPPVPKTGDFQPLRGPDIVPPPEGSGGAALPPLPAEPKPPAATMPALPPVFGRVDVPKPAEPTTQYVNKPDLTFDYEVTKQGKSGVKAVVLYAKPLPDAAWAEAAKVDVGGAERPKLAFTMPKEGRYGFRIGVSSGTVTATPPKATDESEVVVVFDKTPPVIETFQVKPITEPNATRLQFAWGVSEPHTPENAAVLEYQVPGSEKWQRITIGSHTGGSQWICPNDVPATVRVRLTVTDQAGNTAQKVIEAVNTDHTVPQGRLIGVKATDPPTKPELEDRRLDLPPIPKSDEPKK